MIHPVILSGGAGSRLWPMSRVLLPKQLLALASEHSMIQDTILRLRGVQQIAAPTIICNQEHRFLIAEQLREIEVQPAAIVLEPAGRNTAPATAVAAIIALSAHSAEPDPLLLVLPADHVIAEVKAFHAAIETAADLARAGHLVTFGIVPSKPETGYGYIRRGKPLAPVTGAFEVSKFVEKPNLPTAAEYVAAGDYYWNSGMFVFGARQFLDELGRHDPEIVAQCRLAVDGAYNDLDFCRLQEEPFKQSPSISIDRSVMEKTDRAVVLPVDIGWSDIGSWSELWEHQPKDANGNATQGQVALLDTQNCYINTEKQLVATIGVKDLVVVATADAILVADKAHAQDVKTMVTQLKKEGRSEPDIHMKVYRPWGSYECMDRGERFQVKRIIVKPGAKLSLQIHHHRAEHWIVVSGTAEVTRNEEVKLVSENESVYIPLGVSHRIHNPGRIPLHLIEVQSGAYLGEDDIVRTQDTYGRPATEW